MAIINKSKKTQIVRVQPYPISGKIFKAEGQVPIPCQILRLEELGFVCKAAGDHFFKIGEEYFCDFEIPVSKDKILQIIKIIKTTQSIEAYLPGSKQEKVVRIEVHFKSENQGFRIFIRNFLEKIGQNKKTKSS